MTWSARGTIRQALALVFGASMATGACAEERAEWREDAERMVRRQLEARGIADERVLGAMRQVPRHQFVPPRRRASPPRRRQHTPPTRFCPPQPL